MKFTDLILLSFIFIVCSCDQAPSTPARQDVKQDNSQQNILRTGLNIEYGPNLGASHFDDQGNNFFHVHSTAIITNDSIVPIRLELELSAEYDFPELCGESSYKLFMLPQSLTPDTATLYNNIVNGQHAFLNSPLAQSFPLDTILYPGENCVVSVGVLISQPSNCAAVPRGTFSSDHWELYKSCNQLENKLISSESGFQIGVKLEYYNQKKFIQPDDGCAVIPFGRISYP